MKDPRRIPEHALQATLVAFLHVSCRKGVMWHSIPNELPKIEGRAAQFKARGMKAGVADLELTIDGRTHYLELKSKKGIHREAQKTFQLECEANGVPYALARSFEAAVAILAGWGALHRVADRRAA